MNTPTLELQGLFWNIEPPKAAQSKRTPPAPVWLAPDCLPGLEEARAFNVPLMDLEELTEAQARREQLIVDCEVFPNYFLAAFCSMQTGKVWFVESKGNYLTGNDSVWLKWVLLNFETVSFNGWHFDVPILTLAVDGKSCAELQHAATMIISQNVKGWQVLRSFKVEEIKGLNHIDLFNVCPLEASLKIYGGRLHCPKIQDLPFPPDTNLSPEQIDIVRYYCVNDLSTTAFVNVALAEQIKVRRGMSEKYDLDLRSKSDAQIAEAVIKSELRKVNGFLAEAPEIQPGTSYMYHVPAFIKFQTEPMRAALEAVKRARFLISDAGGLMMPPELENLEIKFGKGVYRMGIGGLHSSEEKTAHRASEQFKLVDRDVASYYPSIILNQRLYPSHLGFDFLTVYHSLVTRRLAAKKSGNKIEADMLKITINGSFGKLGNKYSALYAPDLLIQVTITGQLALLMMIEKLELAGVEVCSANTDGIIMKYPRVMEDVVLRVVREWETETNFQTEETEYAAVFSRDVNNYIAMKPKTGKPDAVFTDHKLGFKTKGAYCERGSSGDSVLSKNPENLICIDAVLYYLRSGVPVADTIRGCRDLRRFLAVRTVKGGAVKDGVYLGRAVRWYYGANTGGEIVYASSGNKVPKSEGGKPCMQLPEAFPDDIDYSRYEKEALEILEEIAAI